MEAAFIALASDLLLARVGGEGVAGVLLMNRRRVRFLPLGLLGDGLLVTHARVSLGWSLGGTGAAGGLTVPHGQSKKQEGGRGH